MKPLRAKRDQLLKKQQAFGSVGAKNLSPSQRLLI
jgi:hypothetical protein